MVRWILYFNGSTSGGVTSIWFGGFDGASPTLEMDGTAATDVSHRYLWSPESGELLADEIVTTTSSAGTIQWALADQVGTVRDIARWDSGGSEFEVANHRVYSSFGEFESETNSAIDLTFGFTGQWADPETGYTFHLNRWYDPKIGKWLSEDPIGFSAGDPNLTRYVTNRALTHIDPLGLDEAMGREAPNTGTGSGTSAYKLYGGAGEPGDVLTQSLEVPEIRKHFHEQGIKYDKFGDFISLGRKVPWQWEAKRSRIHGPKDFGFWAAYSYYATNPGEMDTDVQVGFYGGIGIAATFTAGAGAATVAGVGGTVITMEGVLGAAGATGTVIVKEAADAVVDAGISAATGGAISGAPTSVSDIVEGGLKRVVKQGLRKAPATKTVPNPGGRLGNAATRAKTQDVVTDLRARGFTEIEYEVRFRPGSLGSGRERFADVVGRNPITGETEIIQIGRTIKSDPRVPVIRERHALDDIIFSPDIQNFPNSTIRFVDVNRPGVIQP